MFLLKSPKNHTNACISKGSLKEQGVTEPINQSVSQSRLTVHLSPPLSSMCIVYIYLLLMYLSMCIYVYVHSHMYYVCSVYVCMYVRTYQSYMSLWDLLDWIRGCDHQVVQWWSHNGKAENWIVFPP